MCDCCGGEEDAFDPNSITEPLMEKQLNEDKANYFSSVVNGRVESPSNMSDGSNNSDASAFGTNYSCSEYERSLRSPTMEGDPDR